MYSTRVYFLGRRHRDDVLQKLQNRENDVVHVAEARGLRFLRVVKTARPIDHDVGKTLVQATSAADGARAVGTNVIKKAVEDGTVVTNIDYSSLLPTTPDTGSAASPCSPHCPD